MIMMTGLIATCVGAQTTCATNGGSGGCSLETGTFTASCPSGTYEDDRYTIGHTFTEDECCCPSCGNDGATKEDGYSFGGNSITMELCECPIGTYTPIEPCLVSTNNNGCTIFAVDTVHDIQTCIPKLNNALGTETPSDIPTSLITTQILDGVTNNIRPTTAPKIAVTNVTTNHGPTSAIWVITCMMAWIYGQ
jgi:hypothetical protein